MWPLLNSLLRLKASAIHRTFSRCNAIPEQQSNGTVPTVRLPLPHYRE